MKLKYEEGGYENENGTISDHKSRLHSCYAWGVLAVVVVSAGFMTAFGSENWQSMTLVLTLLPAVTSIMMATCLAWRFSERRSDWEGRCIQNMEKALTGFFCSELWEQPHAMQLQHFLIRLRQDWFPVQ